MGDETSFSRLSLSDPEAGVPEQTRPQAFLCGETEGVLLKCFSSSNIPLSSLGAVTPSGYHNFKIVQAVSRKGQCLVVNLQTW